MARREELIFVCRGFKVNGSIYPLENLPPVVTERIAAAFLAVMEKKPQDFDQPSFAGNPTKRRDEP